MKGSFKSEQDILYGFAKGDNEVIKKFINEHYTDIKNFVKSKGGDDYDVEEIVQEAFIVFYDVAKTKGETIKGRVVEYFFGIVKNLYFKKLRKSKETLVLFNEETDVIDDEDVDNVIAQNERYKLYETYLQQMDDDCKKLFRLIYSGVKTKKILKKMNYSLKYLYKKRSLCKKSLIEKIKNDERYNELMKDLENNTNN